MVLSQNLQFHLVLSEVQSLQSGGGRYARTTVSRSPILLRMVSLLAALGGLLMIFAEKPLIVRIFLRPPKERYPHSSCRFSRKWAAWYSCSPRSPGSLHAIPYAMWPSWTRLLVGLCILALTPLLSLWMTDIWQDVSAVPLVRATCRAARSSRSALLAEAAGGALGACREFLKSGLSAAG